MPDISIAEQAARWFARLAAHDCSDAERAAFERWRTDEGCAAAYAEVERVAALLDDALESSDRLRAMAADALQLDASRTEGDDHPDHAADRDDGDCPAVKAGAT